MKTRILLYICALAAIFSCSKADLADAGVQSENNNSIESIVVCGYDKIDGTIEPCYWVNGDQQFLELPDGVIGGKAKAIAVAKGSVYICGSAETLEGEELPCVWKNGEIHMVLKESEYTMVFTDIAIANDGTILVSGTKFVDDIPISGGYWKGGSFIAIDKCLSANSIAIDNGSIYIGGASYNSDGNLIPCYWKGEDQIELSIPSNLICAQVNSIAIENGLVYACGFGLDENTDTYAYSWANGSYSQLGSGSGLASAISVYNSKVLVGGASYEIESGIFKPSAWMDAKECSLGLSSTFSYGYAYSVINGATYYVCGSCASLNEDFELVSKACYWQNGTQKILPSTGTAEAFDIALN